MKQRAWKYCRQDETDNINLGLKTQAALIDCYIKDHDVELVGETQVIESGYSSNRQSLADLLAFAKEGTYDRLLISKTDRLCRDAIEAIKLINHFKELGVEVIAIKEPRFKLYIKGGGNDEN